jgi:hypothetical protein
MMNSDTKTPMTDQKETLGEKVAHHDSDPTSHEHREMLHDKEAQDITPNGSESENGAVKGDDSDGRIGWTARSILATIALSGLYVGTCALFSLPHVGAYPLQDLKSLFTSSEVLLVS